MDRPKPRSRSRLRFERIRDKLPKVIDAEQAELPITAPQIDARRSSISAASDRDGAIVPKFDLKTILVIATMVNDGGNLLTDVTAHC